MISHFILGKMDTKVGSIPLVSGKLSIRDKIGSLLVRLSVNRNKYSIEPGLYAIGKPDATSDIFVTANYKLSFDNLRKSIDGLNSWILVLDTKGINVWCAAGKGTFSTAELVNKIRQTRLADLVSHRRIIVPQLGAVGISAHEVKKQTSNPQTGLMKDGMTSAATPVIIADQITVSRGFNVIYGPVKASHIKDFITNKYVACPDMRKVTFSMRERAILIPVDFVQGMFKFLIAFVVMCMLSGLSRKGISLETIFIGSPGVFINMLLAFSAGIVLTPLLLPYLPGRSFSFKGFIAGIFSYIISELLDYSGINPYEKLSWFLIMVSISSFVAMNFTGSSTFTSLSGVKKEMKSAIPLQISLSVIGLALFITGKVI
jgi:hypothetical protein